MSWEDIGKIAKEAGRRLGLPNKPGNAINGPGSHFDSDNAYTIMQLRNRVHDMEIEIIKLEAIIRDDDITRDRFPAVQDAWDQYQTLKKLTKD